MNPNYFIFVSVFVNTCLIVLFPTQLLGNDIFGIDLQRESAFDNSQYFSNDVRENLEETGFFNQNTGASNQDQLFNDVTNPQASEGTLSFLGDVGNFIDWFLILRDAFRLIFTFAFAFIIILFSLPAPLNFLFAVPLSVAYIFSIARLITNR